MGIDQDERRRQRKVDRGQKPKHPYAAIEHRILGSHAFESLTGNAAKLLMLLAGQITPAKNNGRLKTSPAVIPRHVMAEHTVSRATSELIAHGLIYRTCGREYDAKTGRGKAALYALTWVELTKQADGLHLHGFNPRAWQEYRSENKKPPAEMQSNHSNSGIYAPSTTANLAGVPPPKIARQKLLVPVHDDITSPSKVDSTTTTRASAEDNWLQGTRAYLGRFGLRAGPQVVVLP